VGETHVTRAEAVGSTVRLDGDVVILTIDDANQPVALRILGKDVDVRDVHVTISRRDEVVIDGRIVYVGEPPLRAWFSAPVTSPSP
jgi:hypothetical protein